MNNNRRIRETGGVSLFIVIFTCLLVTIVTVSFVGIMVRNQQQATNTDLSSSAYDSAMAGVEDAKRLAIVYRDCQDHDDTTSAACVAAIEGVDGPDKISGTGDEKCNSIQTGLGLGNSNEVPIKSSSSDTNSAALNQAYTCVKVTYNTLDVKRTIRDGETQMVVLRAADGPDADTNPDTFNRVKITWRGGSVTPYTGLPATVSLPQNASWGTKPPVMRTQLLQTAPSFTLDDFNTSSATNSNVNTVFLYPFSAGSATVDFTASDPRPSATPRTPVQSICNDVDPTPGTNYSCSATLLLKNPVGGSAADRSNTFLLLSSVYNSADYKIELFNGATPVRFDGVQPSVDATGRANDLFRRVDARVEFDAGQFNYPSAALDINGDLCKAFAVTDSAAPDGGYNDGGCTP